MKQSQRGGSEHGSGSGAGSGGGRRTQEQGGGRKGANQADRAGGEPPEDDCRSNKSGRTTLAKARSDGTAEGGEARWGRNVQGRSYGVGEDRSERIAVRGEQGGVADQRRGRTDRGDPDRKTDPEKAARGWTVVECGGGLQTAVKGRSSGRSSPPHLARKGDGNEVKWSEQWIVYREGYKGSGIGAITKRQYPIVMIYEYGIAYMYREPNRRIVHTFVNQNVVFW